MDIKRRFLVCSALVGLSAIAQAVTIQRAVVPAQDSIRYLVVAQAMARDGLLPTLKTQNEQPLFPAAVWLTHQGLVDCGLIGPADWAVSLQIAAAVPLVFAVVSVYLLLGRLVGGPSALAASLLFCLLGSIRRLGADGLSDSTHLCFCCWALWAGCHYFAWIKGNVAGRKPNAAWLAAMGAFTGIALLARAEAIVLPLAAAATMGLAQLRPAWRQCWFRLAGGGTALVAGMALVLVPYLALGPARDVDSIVARLLGRQGADESAPLNLPPGRVLATGADQPGWRLEGTGQLTFGRKDTAASGRFHGYAAAAAELARELVEALDYWVAALAAWGLWSCRRFPVRPADRFVQLAALGIMAGVLKVAATGGYLSERHLLVPITLSLACAGVGAVKLARLASRNGFGAVPSLGQRLATFKPALVQCSMPAALGLLCWVSGPDALHASRSGHLQAARWLETRTRPDDVVLDSRGWTALYTGRTTYRYDAAQAAYSHPRLAYIVVERAELESPSRRGETLRLLMEQAGEPVARFSPPAGRPVQQVLVYRWHPLRFAELKGRLDAR